MVDISSSMKYILSLLILFFSSSYALSQNVEGLPEGLVVLNMNNEAVSFNDELKSHEGNRIVVFWAAWCTPCKRQLNELSEYYEFEELADSEIFAINIDDRNGKSKAESIIQTEEWSFKNYFDPESILRRKLMVNNIPEILIVDTNDKIVFRLTKSGIIDLYELIEILESQD